MKQSKTQTAVNCSKKLKSTRNSTEAKDNSAATYFNRHIRQTFTERNWKSPKWADLALGDMLDSDVPCGKIPYRSDQRLKFVTHRVSDEALVSMTGTTWVPSRESTQLSRTNGRSSGKCWRMKDVSQTKHKHSACLQCMSLTSSPTLVCNKVEPRAWSVRCFPTAVHETLWQSIVDGPRWKEVVRLASRNSRTAAVLSDRDGVS